jgi:hypothetical protein
MSKRMKVKMSLCLNLMIINKYLFVLLISIVLMISCNSGKHVTQKFKKERYLYLEDGFQNDRIKIMTNKSLLIDTTVSTNQISSNALSFKFQSDQLKIKINKDTSFFVTHSDSNYNIFLITKRRDLNNYFFYRAIDTILIRW